MSNEWHPEVLNQSFICMVDIVRTDDGYRFLLPDGRTLCAGPSTYHETGEPWWDVTVYDSVEEIGQTEGTYVGASTLDGALYSVIFDRHPVD